MRKNVQKKKKEKNKKKGEKWAKYEKGGRGRGAAVDK